MEEAREGKGSWQSRLFDEEGEPEWVEVDTKRVRVEGVRDFGGCWLGLQMVDKLDLIPLLDRLMPGGREEIPWSMMALTLVLMRLCEPSSPSEKDASPSICTGEACWGICWAFPRRR